MNDKTEDPGNVVTLSVNTVLDIPTDRVLSAAVGSLSSVIVLGYTKDGEEYFASSTTNSAESNWLVDRFKQFLLDNSE